MSDTTTTPEPSPSPTPSENQPPPENEPITANPTPAKTGITEKVRNAAARVLGQAGFSFKKGRGRPRNCVQCGGIGCESCEFTGKMPGKLDGPLPGDPVEIHAGNIGPTPGAADLGTAPAWTSPAAALFRRSCIAAVKGVLGILKAVVKTYADAAGIEPSFTDKTLAKAEPDPEALADFTESLDVVLKKYNVQPKNAEEWALAINAARLVAPYALLIAEFKGEIKRQREESHERREQEKETLRKAA